MTVSERDSAPGASLEIKRVQIRGGVSPAPTAQLQELVARIWPAEASRAKPLARSGPASCAERERPSSAPACDPPWLEPQPRFRP